MGLDLARELKEPWLETGKKLPRNDVSRAMAASDYLLLLDVNKNQSRTQVPGKLFEYVRIGRPILAFTNKGSDTEYILERSGIPHVCIYQAASPEETDRRLLSFFDLPSEPSRPSEWFQREFDGIRQAEVLAAILTELDP